MPVDGVATIPSARSRDGLRRYSAQAELMLLDSFDLRCDGTPVPLPASAQRLLAFLALHDHPVLRVYVAGMLWLDTPEERAFANLRSTLWRLNRSGHRLVEATSRDLRLTPEVRVDFCEATRVAHLLLGGSTDPDDLDVDWKPLAGELLPDWYDEWVLIERERFRQLGLHALETLSERLAASRRFGQALEAVLAAIAGEPLRESAHRVLIKTHLAEGNTSEAIRQYRFYRKLLSDQLDLDPSPAMEALVEGLTGR
jgi:DNA-binding SARP family transcriptional activator